jgi:DNA invertase Pin-like site-specific DNA recombinase
MASAGVDQFVFIYARASLDRQEQRISVDRQIARCERLADDLYSGVPVRVYQDNDRSASDPDVVRDEYQRMLAGIRRGECLALVAHEQSRLTRQTREWDELVVTLTRAEITKVHTKQQGTIGVEVGNRLVGRIMNVIDAEESERIRARSTAMAEQLADEGRPPGGRFYGFRRHRGPDGTRRPELEVIPVEAAVIRRIVNELLAGHGANAVAERLNNDGVPTPRNGQLWRGQSVLAIARKPHIAGLRVYHGCIAGPARWEAIITPERFEALQRTLGAEKVIDVGGQRKRVGRTRGDTSRKWLLTGGLARCGPCGAPLAVVKVARPDGYVSGYACTKRSGFRDACGGVTLTPAELVEELVTEEVLRVLGDSAMAARLHHADDPARAAATRAVVDADARVARAAELFGTGEIDEATWRTMHAPAATRAAEARARLAATEPPYIDLPPAAVVRDRWAELPLKARQEVLKRYVEAIRLLPQTARPANHRLRVAQRLDIVWRA